MVKVLDLWPGEVCSERVRSLLRHTENSLCFISCWFNWVFWCEHLRCYTVLMLVSRSVQRDIYYVIFFHVSRSTWYMIFENILTHKLSYFWQYGIKAGCRFVKWYWFLYKVRDKWENISLDFVSWDIFSLYTEISITWLTTSCYSIQSFIFVGKLAWLPKGQ